MSERRLLKEGFVDPWLDHYEEKFEFPFWKLVREYAEEHDVSYSVAAAKVCPEYVKTINYADVAWADEQIAKREREGVGEVQDSSRTLEAGGARH